MQAGPADSEHHGSFESAADLAVDWDCQSCGACCSYSSEWPRFTLETDEALDRIPEKLVAADGRGMRCEGERCSALSGQVGVGASCTIYEVRPDVCRACNPGDDECRMARAAFGLDSVGHS
ncbi:Fe-S-cluster containining protein [Neorhizobium huautlense]|uniref:Fe-S-cluster containining protein n=1 Tax=Neorhizobium huautlense TaxID=67774 RepID=A0ABT9PV67_9HYPH|nr:YkgJ family cysteine cluster protein [Neorhizobium huautlense]MDP9838367.1 Fe-S-cluster containining protein [Neorhizobium huautlense]